MLISNGHVDGSLRWFNEPVHEVRNSRLYLKTDPGTDFWQRTHYGFRRDDGHCLLTAVFDELSLTESNWDKEH